MERSPTKGAPRRLRLRVLLTAAVAAAVVMAGPMSTPANADQDYPPLPAGGDAFRLTAPQVDFGSGNLNIFGDPSDGTLLWMWDPDDREWWPWLLGTLFINNAAGLCARVQIVYHDSLGVELDTRNGGTVCSPSNRLHKYSVNLMPFGHSRITHIHVNLQTVGWNGVATTVDTQTLYP